MRGKGNEGNKSAGEGNEKCIEKVREDVVDERRGIREVEVDEMMDERCGKGREE